jgi:hypothetical protein
LINGRRLQKETAENSPEMRRTGMTRGKRIQSALGWGFFYGICSWVLASGVTNKIPTLGVWGFILSQTILGLIIALVKWNIPWWARGIALGAAVNLPLGLLMRFSAAEWTRPVFWPFVLFGVLAGFLIELGVRYSSNSAA